MLVDSHCHLDFPDFATERAAIIARARSAGVETMLTIGTRLDEFPGVRSIAEAHEEVWCSVGAHPHEAKDHAELAPEELIALTAHPKVVGIGETGLDFHYDLSPRDTQEQVFRTHIAASRATGLPLVIHAREADREIARILEEERPPPGVMHCFSSGRALAEAALALGATGCLSKQYYVPSYHPELRASPSGTRVIRFAGRSNGFAGLAATGSGAGDGADAFVYDRRALVDARPDDPRIIGRA